MIYSTLNLNKETGGYFRNNPGEKNQQTEVLDPPVPSNLSFLIHKNQIITHA